jgi:hypothetical protein
MYGVNNIEVQFPEVMDLKFMPEVTQTKLYKSLTLISRDCHSYP